VETISSKEIGLIMKRILFNIKIERIREKKEEPRGILASKIRTLLPIR
jgi:hypothetical protein